MNIIETDKVIVPEKLQFSEIDEQALESLKEDIKKNGIKNPIKVKMQEGIPYVVDGRNRYLACMDLGIMDIPVEWVDDDVSLEEAVVGTNETSL